MQFRLPSNLQTELLAYDPVLKKLARSNNPKTKTKKSTHPLGNPKGLIPVDVVRESLLDDAITHINSNPAAERYHKFTRVVNGEVIVTAILYHHEQCWYAAWLPPQGQEGKYVYGYAFAFKDTQAARNMIPNKITNFIDSYQQVITGRSVMYQHQALVDVELICAGQTSRNWNIPGVASYYAKSKEIHVIIKQFENQLATTIPTWNDTSNIFDRLASKHNLPSILFDSSSDVFDNYWENIDKTTWQASYESLFDLITYHAHNNRYAGETYKEYNKILHIISKPFFKKWIQQQCNQVNETYIDETNEYRDLIRRPWLLMKTLFKRILYINNIWPDCPIDYYQNYIKQLIGVNFTNYTLRDVTVNWLKQHMPVASFFQIIAKHYDKETKDDLTNRIDKELGVYTYRFYDWNDTTSMLTRILEHDPCLKFAPPKRWRIEEFHDYVLAESWKIKNPNQSLPQDLFPTPVRIQLGSSTWSFFQPIDTHQLGEWGQAVRNCVGNASSYAEGVRKKQHFIVLCMINGKPQFTVQLKVENGLMSVKQIAGLSNARLSTEQDELYTTAFSQALQARENELVSH